MPHFTNKLTPSSGPLFDVVLNVSYPYLQQLKANGSPVPSMVPARALLDTGASGTVVDPSIIQKLAISPKGTGQFITPSTANVPHQAYTYDIALFLNHQGYSKPFLTLPVAELKLAHQGFEVLIGRDVLDKCLFIYDGPSRIFTLSI
ncbi:MAG TPA: retroviral-like aspartic protease family protein [bacterium]|jgi:hypothetical protein|nr:retroviral-like aspartic protease family protein [bacterium]